ncbi:MAG: methyltransferase domain-containing protein [Bacteroidota bacterium]|jgi:SAM-dependent methyltransferase
MINKNETVCCVTQCDVPLDQTYWDTRWEKGETGWDIGYAATAITEYMSKYPDKNAAILIPGCGNAYEAEWLATQGFTNITLIDIAPKAVARLKEKFQNTPEVKVLCEDFFQHEAKYDLMIEQTFFCAIPPFKRKDYVKKAASLLHANGKIIGVLFDKTFEQPGPPFGGCACEYKPLFEPFFVIHKMEACYNSIPPRAGSELFIHCSHRVTFAIPDGKELH